VKDDFGTRAMKKLIKQVEKMSVEEYLKLHNKAVEMENKNYNKERKNVK